VSPWPIARKANKTSAFSRGSIPFSILASNYLNL
jgi:hypothetical protein